MGYGPIVEVGARTASLTLIQQRPCRVRRPQITAADETHPKYRPDIDGLRAVAVLAVVGYHLFPTLVPGGFIGVDLFFVISGYLISTIIITDVSAGSFSFVTFYARRAKRILPALISVSVVAILLFAQVFYAPQILQALQSLMASFLFSANIYFYVTTDYFGPAVTELPFLHYWSLGVEEQYYLLFPLLALLLGRFRARFQIAAYIVLALASLIGSEFVLRSYPPAAYYLISWRAWELMVGTLAYFVVARVRVSGGIATAAFWIGIAAIGYSLATLNARSTFPGLNALPGCIGAALVIVSGARTEHIGNKILGSLVPNYIGRISYSLYLIHWPVYVIASASLFSGAWFSNPVVMLLASIVLAAMNYAWVEQPFRRFSGVSNGKVLIISGSTIAVLLVLCFAWAVHYNAVVERAKHFRHHVSLRWHMPGDVAKSL